MNLHNISQSQNFSDSLISLIHHNFLNPGESITAEKYCLQIEKLQLLYPALINKNDPILFYDNYHTSLDWFFKSWTNWATRSLIYHTCQISRLSITTFSSTLTTSCIRNASNLWMRNAETAFNVCHLQESRILFNQNKKTYFSLTKVHWLQ